MTRLFFDPRLKAAFFLVWCLVWTILALFSVRPDIPHTPFTDSQLHFIAYMLMSGSAIVFCSSGMQLLAWTGLTVTFGFSIECVQYFLPTRNFELVDLMANTAGAGVGFMLALFVLYSILRPLRRAFA